MLTALKSVLGISYNQLLVDNPSLAGELAAAVSDHGEELAGDQLTTPLRWVPIALEILDEARLDEVLAAATLGPSGEAAVQALGRPEALDPPALDGLVAATSISGTEATMLGQAVERYLLCDEHAPLVTAVNTVAAGQSNAQLAAWTAGQWLIGAPSGRDRREVALAIRRAECEDQFLPRPFEDGPARKPLDGPRETCRLEGIGGLQPTTGCCAPTRSSWSACQ